MKGRECQAAVCVIHQEGVLLCRTTMQHNIFKLQQYISFNRATSNAKFKKNPFQHRVLLLVHSTDVIFMFA